MAGDPVWHDQALDGRRFERGVGRSTRAGIRRRAPTVLPVDEIGPARSRRRERATRGAGSRHPFEARLTEVRIMSAQPPRPIGVGLRLYRALSRAFPHEFRNVY